MTNEVESTGVVEREMTPQERLLKSLMSTLLERTEAGSLAWEEDDARVDSYCISGDDWVIATRSVDGDGIEPFALVVADSEGEPILELRSSRAYARPFREMFGQLHVAAAATAVIADATPTLTSILGQLESARASQQPGQQATSGN